MHVIATAGHVDHGKSTLVRALTGMEPDRWAEERRRGMTIDLGFAWTGSTAFVDVPGHERFVPNMLAGVGPVPAVMFVVAADGGWMPQSAEHLAALDALGVRHGLLVVTRSDLADPGPALAAARAEIARASLGAVDAVTVSGLTGAGLDELRAALDRLVAALPGPDRDAPVRLWVDRSFTIRGSGTVVTGTLGAGTVRGTDTFELSDGEPVRVRGIQTLGAAAAEVAAVARVALNLRGIDHHRVRRGDALTTPGAFRRTDLVDVRLPDGVPTEVTLHIGSAAVPARVRPLGPGTARLRLARPLPLRVGDRALLRDPGRHHIAGGADVLDVAPPALTRRGAARAWADALSGSDELRRRGLVRRADLARMGVAVDAAPVTGDWLADPEHWADLRRRLVDHVGQALAARPLDEGVPVDTLRRALDLPDRTLVAALVAPPLVLRSGLVTLAGREPALPAPVAEAVARLRADLATDPFGAPDSARLAELGLGPRELAAATRAGELLRVADGIVLGPDAVAAAVRVLEGLPQPFTISAARQALRTSRRVAVPLLQVLDSLGTTRRLPDDRRELTAR